MASSDEWMRSSPMAPMAMAMASCREASSVGGLRSRRGRSVNGGSGGGPEEPPSPSERQSQDEPPEDEWQVSAFGEGEVRLARIHMLGRFRDFVPREGDLPPGFRLQDLDGQRITEIMPNTESAQWERTVDDWRTQHWERPQLEGVVKLQEDHPQEVCWNLGNY